MNAEKNLTKRFIDGEITECCANHGIDESSLRNSGIGQSL